MIQPTALLSSTTSTFALAPVAMGGMPAFDLSLAKSPEATMPTVQPLAAPGRTLPTTSALAIPALAIDAGAAPAPDLAASSTPAASLPVQAIALDPPHLETGLALPGVTTGDGSVSRPVASADVAERVMPRRAPDQLAARVAPTLPDEQPARSRVSVGAQPDERAAADMDPANIPLGDAVASRPDGTSSMGYAPDRTAVWAGDAMPLTPASPPFDAATTALASVPASNLKSPVVVEPTSMRLRAVRPDLPPELSVARPELLEARDPLVVTGERAASDPAGSPDPLPPAAEPRPTPPLAETLPAQPPARSPADAAPMKQAPTSKAAAPTKAPDTSLPGPAAPLATTTAKVTRFSKISSPAGPDGDLRSMRPGTGAQRPLVDHAGPSFTGPAPDKAESAILVAEAQPKASRAPDQASADVVPPSPAVAAVVKDGVAPPVTLLLPPSSALTGSLPVNTRRIVQPEAPAASPPGAALRSADRGPDSPPPEQRGATLAIRPTTPTSIETVAPVTSAPNPSTAPTTVTASPIVDLHPGVPVGAPPSPIAEALSPQPIAGGSTVSPPVPATTVSPLSSVPEIAAPAVGTVDRDIASPSRTADLSARVQPPASAAPLMAAGTTAPAFRLFAAAIHAARTEENDRTAPPAATLIASVEQPRPGLAIAGAQGTPLDMTDRRWPHAMIEHIDRLQEAVGAARDTASTTIRLVPDALGTIDVGVRRDGDTVHVHFHAEQAQTRALIADAQPRLMDLAEAKGIRLAQSNGGPGVGAGLDGQAQRQPAPRSSSRAAPFHAERNDETAFDTTTRVA